MKPALLVATLSLMIAGCTTSAYPTYTASGNAGYRVVCGGIFGDGDLGSCYQKAGELCGGQGYRIQQTSVNSMIFECKEAETDSSKSQ